MIADVDEVIEELKIHEKLTTGAKSKAKDLLLALPPDLALSAVYAEEKELARNILLNESHIEYFQQVKLILQTVKDKENC